jgi:hypothetical protein
MRLRPQTDRNMRPLSESCSALVALAYDHLGLVGTTVGHPSKSAVRFTQGTRRSVESITLQGRHHALRRSFLGLLFFFFRAFAFGRGIDGALGFFSRHLFRSRFLTGSFLSSVFCFLAFARFSRFFSRRDFVRVVFAGFPKPFRGPAFEGWRGLCNARRSLSGRRSGKNQRYETDGDGGESIPTHVCKLTAPHLSCNMRFSLPRLPCLHHA